MRIISGVYKSRILKSPDSNNIRPTSDRAKETLFNILNNRIEFESAICMDLFCGSGSLGLECISRGAGKCYFIDEDTKLVRKNVELLNVEEKSKIIKSEAINFLNGFDDARIDLVFCDPPYDYVRYTELLEKISGLNTILVLEHSDKFQTDTSFEKNVFLKKKIGTVNFTFFNFTTAKNTNEENFSNIPGNV